MCLICFKPNIPAFQAAPSLYCVDREIRRNENVMASSCLKHTNNAQPLNRVLWRPQTQSCRQGTPKYAEKHASKSYTVQRWLRTLDRGGKVKVTIKTGLSKSINTCRKRSWNKNTRLFSVMIHINLQVVLICMNAWTSQSSCRAGLDMWSNPPVAASHWSFHELKTKRAALILFSYFHFSVYILALLLFVLAFLFSNMSKIIFYEKCSFREPSQNLLLKTKKHVCE